MIWDFHWESWNATESAYWYWLFCQYYKWFRIRFFGSLVLMSLRDWMKKLNSYFFLVFTQLKIFQKYIHIFPPTFAKTDYLFWPEFLNFFGGKFKFGKTSRWFFTSLLVFNCCRTRDIRRDVVKKIKVWKTFFRIWFTFYWSFYSWIVFNNNKKELPRLKVSSKVATCLNGRLAIYLSSKNTFYRMNWWGRHHT